MKAEESTYLSASQLASISTKQISKKKGIKNYAKRIWKFLTRKTTIIEVICSLLIILFIYTGFNKLMDLHKFKGEMGRSPFIEQWAGKIAYIIPWGEILLVFALVIPKTRLLGLYLSLSLMSLFTGYIWLMLNYAYDLPCSCGGIISKMTWHEHLLFNASFTGLIIIAILLYTKQQKRI